MPFYKLLGVILRLFSQLSDFFIALLSLKRAKTPGTEIRDSNKALRKRSLYFRRCCLYAAKSGTEQLAAHVSRATLLSNAQTYSVLFPRLPLTTTHAHTVPFFRRLLLLIFSITRVIRRQRRNTAPLKIEGDTENLKHTFCLPSVANDKTL